MHGILFPTRMQLPGRSAERKVDKVFSESIKQTKDVPITKDFNL